MFSHLHSRSTFHPSSKDIDDGDDMQIKGLRRVMKGLRRSLRQFGRQERKVVHAAVAEPQERLSPFDAHHSIDSPLLVDIARDSPSLPITIPVSPTTKAVTSSNSSTTFDDEPLSLAKAQMSDGSSMTSESQTSESSNGAPVDQSSQLEAGDHVVSGEPEEESAMPLQPTLDGSEGEARPEERSSTLDSPFDALSGAATEDIVSPTPMAEPEVPDPFIVDASDESVSGEEEEDNAETPGLSADRPEQALVAASEITLAQSVSSDSANVPEHPLPSVDVHKAVPPPPAADSSDEEEEVPEIYAPGLIIPTMFLPIPNVRLSVFYSLTWWLSKRLLYEPCIIRQTH